MSNCVMCYGTNSNQNLESNELSCTSTTEGRMARPYSQDFYFTDSVFSLCTQWKVLRCTKSFVTLCSNWKSVKTERTERTDFALTTHADNIVFVSPSDRFKSFPYWIVTFKVNWHGQFKFESQRFASLRWPLLQLQSDFLHVSQWPILNTYSS